MKNSLFEIAKKLQSGFYGKTDSGYFLVPPEFVEEALAAMSQQDAPPSTEQGVEEWIDDLEALEDLFFLARPSITQGDHQRFRSAIEHVRSISKRPLHQNVEEWISENEFKDSWGVNAVYTKGLRAFLAGKVLVPVEPTKEMVVAGHHAAWRRIPSIFDFDDAENVYKAMLTASKLE